jgi:D-lyxose ketol-isomerase
MNVTDKFRSVVIKFFKKSRMFFRDEEFNSMEITDFGLGDFLNIGLGLIIYVNTKRVCAKEIALLSYQICPQHMHPDINDQPGKEETFRCRWGEVYLYIPGPKTEIIKGKIPKSYYDKFNVFHEVILKPGDQYTIAPRTWHWFQAGPDGAVISEFSTHSFDEGDIFFDKNIKRIAVDN